jgi:hypothetical protein
MKLLYLLHILELTSAEKLAEAEKFYTELGILARDKRYSYIII